MSQISVVLLFKQGHFLGACTTPQALNTALFTEGPKACWLSKTAYCCGGDEAYKLTFSKPADINALSGVFVAEAGIGYVIDGTVSDVIAKANGCCGDNAVVTPVYNGTFPAIVFPLAKTYTITRTDNGDLMASDKLMVDYMKYIIDGTYLKTAYSGGVSTYVFQSYSDPIPQGGDTIVETARVFTSNTAPSLTGSNVFLVTGVMDGVAYSLRGTTALSSTVTALNADPVISLYGTWSVSGSTIVLTTKAVDRGTIVIGQEA